MNKEKIITALNKYDYNFTEQKEKIIVKLDYSHQIIIDLSNPLKVIITDKLVGWNFLTGSIQMNMKNAMLYNFIGTNLFGFLILFTNAKTPIFSLFLIFITWILMWTLFYLTKAESLKRQIISWTK